MFQPEQFDYALQSYEEPPVRGDVPGRCETVPPDLDWHRLVGTVVNVLQNHRIIRTGLVEDATPCGSVIWVAAHGVDRRMMIAKEDGYQLLVASKQPSPAG